MEKKNSPAIHYLPTVWDETKARRGCQLLLELMRLVEGEEIEQCELSGVKQLEATHQ